MLVKRMFEHLREVGLFNLVSTEIKSVRLLERWNRAPASSSKGEVEQ